MGFLRVAVLLVLMAGVGAGTWWFVSASQAKAEAARTQAAAARPASAAAGPLPVQVIVARPEPIDYTIAAVGSLAAGESVAITSEQSLRLMAIHVEEGEKVKQGRLLFELDDSDLVYRQQQLEAEFEQARLAEKRLAELLASNSTSPAAYDEARARLDVIAAQIEQVKNQIRKTDLQAPFTGRVGIRQVSVGAWITPSMVLTTLQDTDRIKVDLKVPERYAPFVEQGQVIRFRTEATSQWSEAGVIAIEPAIERETRSLIVRAVAANTSGLLLPGSFVTAEIPVRTDNEALMVPTEAIVPSTQGDSLFVVVEGKARPRPVKLGLRTAAKIQVVEGLQPGDQVIVSNLLRLRPGLDVAPTPVE